MASSPAATEAQIKSEIERLTATINQHKAHQQKAPQYNGGYPSHYSPHYQGGPPRSNLYVNSNYKPANRYVRPGLNPSGMPTPTSTSTTPSTASPAPTGTPVAGPSTNTLPAASAAGQKKEVVLGGVAFESSARSLVRKDLPKVPKPVSIGKAPPASRPHSSHPYVRKSGYATAGRAFKPKALRGRNMTLNNTGRPYQPRKGAAKRVNKYIDKPCPRFTMTGSCSRGLTCPYQHDPSKIAICWNFLQDNCSKTAETCNLSHDPTPERTPLCVHFLNKGRCNRVNCPYPHVNVGPRQGVCRDFAVLGYCERGLECDHQHVRECPDFAEKGTCETKGCKLPHVIRANRNRKVAETSTTPMTRSGVKTDDKMETSVEVALAGPVLTAEDGQLGDEYISLTFKESDSEDEEEESEGESQDEDDDDDDGMGDIEVHM